MGLKPHHFGSVGVSLLSAVWGAWLLISAADPMIRATGLGLAVFAGFTAATFYMIAIGAGQNTTSEI